MKIRSCIILIIALSFSLTAFAQEPIQYAETVYRHKARFPRIFQSGELSSQVQLCDPRSVCVGTGLFIMEKASIGEIEKCKMYLYVVKDTIRSVRVVARGKDNVQALRSQVIKQFGEPVHEEQQNGTTFYKWPDRWDDGVKITTQLAMAKKEAEFREWYNSGNSPVSVRDPGLLKRILSKKDKDKSIGHL